MTTKAWCFSETLQCEGPTNTWCPNHGWQDHKNTKTIIETLRHNEACERFMEAITGARKIRKHEFIHQSFPYYYQDMVEYLLNWQEVAQYLDRVYLPRKESSVWRLARENDLEQG